MRHTEKTSTAQVHQGTKENLLAGSLGERWSQRMLQRSPLSNVNYAGPTKSSFYFVTEYRGLEVLNSLTESPSCCNFTHYGRVHILRK